MSKQTVPDILKQKLTTLENTSKTIIPINVRESNAEEKSDPESFENARFLLSKGIETGYFFVTGRASPGTLHVFDYRNGTANAKLVLDYKFGRTALIVDVLYFPIDCNNSGIVVAVTDRSLDKNNDYLAYISLETKRLLKAFYLPHPITTLCTILDGTATRSQFKRLSSSFHEEWPHILLVGCRYGYVSLVSMGLSLLDNQPNQFLHNGTLSPSTLSKQFDQSAPIEPVRLRKNVHLSKIFYEDQMFVFRADDGTTRCMSKDRVYVSAMHWIERPGLAVVGFNFGGIMIVSLRTSKVYSMLYLDSQVQQFAVLEPEEDPRPLLYFWIAFNSIKTGTTLLMCTMNFPKDEEAAKSSKEYTFLEPYFSPSMKWCPDNCTRLITMRTIYMRKRASAKENAAASNTVASGTGKTADFETSLLFISWLEQTRRGATNIHGAIFDLNAFYAKRLIPRIVPDSTLARQIPFIARFSQLSAATERPGSFFLDTALSDISQFAPPAFLNENIDQLYYPSTYHLKINCLSNSAVFQAIVQPIQVQLVCDLAQNIVEFFASPHEPALWIHAIGLANSAPSDNINEERACLLRVIVHIFFPGIFTLIDSTDEQPDWLKFIQKWAWKEVEITKSKFDDICSPLFANPPYEPSPSARAFIQHARVFFKRASSIFEALNAKMLTFAEQERSRSLAIQGKAIRQIRLYSAAIAFALVYNLLPVNKLNSQLYEFVAEQFMRRSERARNIGKGLEVHRLIDEIIKIHTDEDVWQGKSALEWYPPRDFKSFFPILLLVNITEDAKLDLLGYYCLDLEAASVNFSSNVEAKDGNTPPSSSAIRNARTSSSDQNNGAQEFRNQKYFALFISFLLQDNFSLQELNRVRALWLHDSGTTAQGTTQNSVVGQQNGNGRATPGKSLQICSNEGIAKFKEECLKQEWGIYKFNEAMLDGKCYRFLVDLSPLTGTEPEFVQRCHARCADIRRRFPSMFEKTQPLPSFVVERYKNKSRHENNLISLASHPQKQPILPLNIKQSPSLALANDPLRKSMMPTEAFMGKGLNRKTITATTSLLPNKTTFDVNAGDQYEELPLTIATPRKRQHLQLMDSTPVIPQLFMDMVEVAGEELAAQSPPSSGDGVTTAAELLRTPVACNIIQKQTINEKDWDRIAKVTQTPLSLRKSINQSKLPTRQTRPNLRNRVRTSLFAANPDQQQQRLATATAAAIDATDKLLIRSQETFTSANGAATIADDSTPIRQIAMSATIEQQYSPELSQQPKPVQPSSILKTDKHRSRLPSESNTTKQRLRFAQSLFTTEQIPSRYERANDERHDTSFSNFTTLSSGSPTSGSASALHEAESVICTPAERNYDDGEEILRIDGPLDPELKEKEEHPVQKEKEEQPAQMERQEQAKTAELEEQSDEEPNAEVENRPTESAELEEKLQEQESHDIQRKHRQPKTDEFEPIPQPDFDTSTTTNWMNANMRRRSGRIRKTTEHFDPVPAPASPTRRSPVRSSPSRQEKDKTPSNHEKTPSPIPQTPPTSSKKRGRPPKDKDQAAQLSPQTPRKKSRSSSGRKTTQKE